MQSLSNRAEIVKGAGSNRDVKASHPTSRSYAGGRWVTAAVNRHKAVILTHMAANGLRLSAEDVRCDSIPLSVLRQLRDKVELAESLAVRGPPWALESTVLNFPSL